MKEKLQSLFDKRNIKQTLLNSAYILFLLALLYRLTLKLFSPYKYLDWSISEFLINYQAGFVRRGITGEILFFFAKNFNIDLILTIKVISLICFFAMCTFFISAFLKKGYSLYILPLCFFLGSPILSGYWIRKDCLMICIFLLTLWVYNKSNLKKLFKVIFINILSVFIILTHEVYAFIAFPILLVLFWNMYHKTGNYKSIIFAFISLSPSIFAFILTIIMHGDQETAQAIWDSWSIILNQSPSKVESHNAIGSLGWGTKHAFNHHINNNFLAIDKNIAALVIWCITFPTVYYISTNALLVFRKTEAIFTSKHKMVLSSILIFQLLCLSPVFALLSCDYIRMFFYWIASSFAVFLIIPLDKIERIIPSFFIVFINRLNDILSNILFPRKTTLVLLMLFLGISTYSFVLDLAFTSSMIYNILTILSYTLKLLFYLLRFIF